jgi:DNA-binding SARP family transcriptional activator
MEFRVLGRLEVAYGGRPIELGGERQRALLAILLLGRGEVMSADRLIDDLYGADPPPTAPKSLQAHISRLRKALGPEAPLQRAGTGYVLDLSESELDADRFSRLLDEGRDALASGRAEEARQHFEGALALWRGPPLVDVAYADFAQGEIARLEELRLGAVEDLFDSRLVLGDGAVVSDLRKLVSEHPLRERLRALYMRALYRAGRQADALKEYQEAREALVEGLGVEPGHELRTLHQAILNQDSSLDGQVPSRPDAVLAEPDAEVVPTSARQARKTVTALCVRLGQRHVDGGGLDPETLRRLTSEAFAHVESAVQRHGGTVEILAGDAVTAVFGLAVVNEDDALRSLRAAVEIRDSLSDVELDFHVGVSSGEVVTGGDRSSQLRATGRPITDSAVLAQTADLGEILVDGATEQLVRHTVIVEASDGASRVVSIAEPSQERVGRFFSPMIGRQRERRRLHDAFEQAMSDSSCQLFTVLGVAGVGKSRLVREFIDDLAGRALVAHGRCLPYGEGITYWPVVEAVKEAVDLDEGDSPEQIRQKLAALLEGEDEAEPVAQRVAELIGVAELGGGADERFWAVRTLFEVLARRRPVVLVFDDIHWGEATFLDLIEHIADWAREVPLLVVSIARPELLDVRPGWGGGKLNATAILLEPLSEGESSQLIDNLVGTGLEEVMRRRVIAGAEGNPFFVEEMLAHALEDKHPDGAIKVPPTIQALLAARLDRLGDVERLILECAAIEGKVFHQGAVAELIPSAVRTAVTANVAALVRKELIRPGRPLFAGEHAFRFRHLLIRDAAYDSIPKAVRSGLHECYATWLDSRAGERLVEYEEIIGYHLEQAFRYRAELGPLDAPARRLAHRAAERLGAAGRRAFAHSDAPAAVNLISRAAALLPADDPARVDLVPNVRVVQGMSANLSWAESILSEALETGDERLKAHAVVQRGFLRLFTEPDISPDNLIDRARQALPVFESLGDELGLARAWRLVAQAHYLARRGGACVEASDKALLHAVRAQDSFEVREIFEWLAIALTLGSTVASEALQRCGQLVEIAAGDPFLEVTLLSVRAYLESMQGRPVEAKRLLAAAERIAGDPAYLNTIPYFSFYLGLVDILGGEASAAEAQLRAGCKVFEAVGEKTNYSSVAAVLARVLCAQGRYAEAEEFTKASEQAARPNDVLSNVMWRSVRATVRGRQGELDEAEALAREAVGFAAQSDFLNVHADALVDLADVLRLARRSDEADHVLEEAAQLYEHKGNVVSAAKARSLLASHA